MGKKNCSTQKKIRLNMKLLLLYCTPLAKRLCRLWFMDCRPAGICLSLSWPASEPTSFFRAVNISTLQQSKNTKNWSSRKHLLQCQRSKTNILKQTYWWQEWRGLKVKSGVRLQYIELRKKVIMVPDPVSFLFQQFTILKCAILATVTVVMISVHPGLLASPVEKNKIQSRSAKAFSLQKWKILSSFNNIHVIYIFFLSWSTKGDI